MIRQTAVTLVMTLFVLLMAHSAQCAVNLYTGRMEILATSGKGCEGLVKSHEVSMAFTEAGGELSGYFIGGGITIGRFSGSDAARRIASAGALLLFDQRFLRRLLGDFRAGDRSLEAPGGRCRSISLDRHIRSPRTPEPFRRP